MPRSDCPLRVGDIVTWGSDGKLGHGRFPDIVRILMIHYNYVHICPLDSEENLTAFMGTGITWTWFSDEKGNPTYDKFLMEVKKSNEGR